MGLFGNSVANSINAIGDSLDKVFTSDEERLSKAEILAKMQSEITITELQTRSIYLAGWRPAIGWVFAICLAFRMILSPIIVWICEILKVNIPPLRIDIDSVMFEIIFGMLGMSGLRTYEKQKGLTK